MLILDYRNEPRIMKVVNAPDLSPERKISKLTIMALKAFPSSPWQIAINAARVEIEAEKEWDKTQ
jgi:hypothetical protein